MKTTTRPGESNPNLIKKIEECNYPSVSKIINHLPNSKLIKWKKEVGESVAEYIAEKSAERGRLTHEIIEAYLLKRKHSVPDILPNGLFDRMKHYIDRINNVKLLEQVLISDKLKIQGRVDCIANYGDELCVIEFKTVSRHKEKPKNDWCLQCTAYAKMYEEMYGVRINDFIIICAGEDDSIIVFRRQVSKFENSLEALIKFYHEDNNDEKE